MPKRSAVLDPIVLLDGLLKTTGRKLAFTAKTPAAAKAWQKKTRRALRGCVLGFLDHQKPVPPHPKVIEEVDRGAFVRRKVIIQTFPGAQMPMYVLVPKEGKRPLPCVLALHGHGYGVKDIVGLRPDGKERRGDPGYHKDFGCELARRGFVVVAPEISCFGERTHDYSGISPSPIPSTCGTVSGYAAMLGGSAAGLRAWDGLRAVDYAATLKEVDADRIGAMGISGGGMHAFFSAALDQRIKACVISGYFCDWRRSINAMSHCPCNHIPGVYKLGELSDLAGLIAPRPCLVENGDGDPIFPIADVRDTVKKARKAWAALGAEGMLKTDFFKGSHEIGGRRAYDFLAGYLG